MTDQVPTVLVVDDDESVRQVTRMALELLSHWNVVEAAGGEIAIELARAQPFDVILLDVMMPGLDGLATFDRLLADPLTREIPVVLLTAKATVGPRQPWADHAVRGVIAKPFAVMRLAAEISEILGWDPPPG